MINEKQIADILSLYSKFGWTLQRVLLTAGQREFLGGSADELFRGSDVRESEIDAAWFSRPADSGKESWELRRLSENAYALFEVFESDDEEDIREETRSEMEEKMRDALL